MYTVTQRRKVRGSPAQVWRFLTNPTFVSRWFADCEALAPGGPVRFDFGDGDFFAGWVRSWRPPRELRLAWKFLGIGAAYEVRVLLDPDGSSTDVTVEDSGARTNDESRALEEGWSDFLSRLADCVRTGRNTRYRWTPTFGAEALAPAGENLLERFHAPGWWRETFAECDVRVDRRNGDIVACLRDRAWVGVETEAHVELKPEPDATIVRVSHGGFDRLPESEQLDARKRYASRWVRALEELEVPPE